MNPSTFVVIGDGLAAGAGDFGLSEDLQPFSFPARIAQRLNATFSQPIMEAPGIGPVIGFPELPVRLPQAMQTTVLKEFPPAGPFGNLSIPGLKLADALSRRPTVPVIDRGDSLQTAINLILGADMLFAASGQPAKTQVEYALGRTPTLALVALGYFDVLDAVFTHDLSALPVEAAFRSNYGKVLGPLSKTATVIACTIPDPQDTAYFTPVNAAARVLKAEPAALSMLFRLKDGDAFTPSGLIEAGCRLIARMPSPLPEGAVVPASLVDAISTRVQALNAQIRDAAKEHGALVFDLHGLCSRLKRDGLNSGGRTLTADYLGGIYSLNGVYPGATGHGAIANGVLELLGTAAGTKYAPIDLDEIAAWDPVASYRVAQGPAVTLADLAAMTPPAPPAPRPEEPLSVCAPPHEGRLTLPPGLVQELPISFDSSYFGDALRAAHTREERDIPFGSTPSTLFGGLALLQSHLQGTLRITFTPPQGDITHFEVTHGNGLAGSDAVLAAPHLYKLPAIMNAVTDVPGMVSSGDLNLETGEVTNLTYAVAFRNSALFALVSVNPNLPQTPIMFPGQYGSAWAKFEPRADGKLDFSFSGSTFLPLGGGFGGDQLRFPLPFAGPAMSFASIPGVGTSLHPHLRISTKSPEACAQDEIPAEIPTNTVREYTAFVHNNAFGDKFSLNIPELGGSATGRSHLLGRVHIQFGERTGNSVPIAVSSLVPGGLLAKPPDSLIARVFPGRLSMGFLAHDERLRYPNMHYDMAGVRWADDPFELSIGSIDVRTGRVLGNLLFRGFIIQNVIQSLILMEPRTPKSSWLMRGGAAFHRDPSGQTVFGFGGVDRIPYPEGFAFPQPDLKTPFYAGPNSQLDPYIFMQAMEGLVPPAAGKSGEAKSVQASNGQRFSYTYAIPGDHTGEPATFEYVNETTGGTYRMDHLVWVSFSNSNGSSCAKGECEVVTFTGVGVWDKDPSMPRMASVQISTAPDYPYVTIQVDHGVASNVNTKPAKRTLPLSWAPVPPS